MKPETLFRVLVPATLFLYADRLQAEAAGGSPPAEMSQAGPPEAAPAASVQNPRLTAKEQALLETYDTNHDGVIDDAELADAHASMRTQQVSRRLEAARKLYARLLEKFDTQKKGYLGPEEQQEAAAAIQKRAPQVYQSLLQRFDKDGDGKLDAAETKAMFDQLAKAPEAEAALNETTPTAQTRPAAKRAAMARRLYDSLLDRFDASKKGYLDPDEQQRALSALKAERPNAYDRLLQRFDKDHDGRLDAAEAKAVFDGLGDLPPLPKEKS